MEERRSKGGRRKARPKVKCGGGSGRREIELDVESRSDYVPLEVAGVGLQLE